MFLKEIAFLVPRRPAEVHKKIEISVSLMFLKEIAFLVPRKPAEVHKQFGGPITAEFTAGRPSFDNILITS